MKAQGITPILNVSDIAASFEWFAKWGWKKCWDWGTPPTFGAVKSGEVSIFLCQGAQGGRGRGPNTTTFQNKGDEEGDQGVWMSVWVENVDDVYKECLAATIEVTFPPNDMPWETREMHVRHPDGHVFRVSGEVKHGNESHWAPMTADPYHLQRFIDAQAAVFTSALAELKQGRKRGHWIWFIFPQIKGLGHSANSEFYGISGLAEAAAYFKHPVLGRRLMQCVQAVNAVENRSAEEIFGEIDAMKFRSSMTLFAKAAPQEPLFAQTLEKYFNGELDPLTLTLLSGRT